MAHVYTHKTVEAEVSTTKKNDRVSDYIKDIFVYKLHEIKLETLSFILKSAWNH